MFNHHCCNECIHFPVATHTTLYPLKRTLRVPQRALSAEFRPKLESDQSKIYLAADDMEHICPAEFKMKSWKKPGGLVALRKSRVQFLKEFSGKRIKVEQISGSDILTSEKQQKPAPSPNIAALDFGTTYCSLAIITAGEEFPTFIELDRYRPRVSNAILLKKERYSNPTSIHCIVKEFGPRAQDVYTRLKPDTVHDYLFFERIKMNLQHDPVRN